MDRIIYELLQLIKLLEESTVDSDKANDAIAHIKEIVSLLDEGNTDALEKIYYLFVPGSDITKLAELNNWSDNLKEIHDTISAHTGYIRVQQKRNPSEYFDNVKSAETATYASMPGRLKVSQQKWKNIQTAYNLKFWKKLEMNIMFSSVQEHLSYGDTQPAVVVSVNPFIVAAYSDEMDAVVLLKFPSLLAEMYGIKLHDRLVTINRYMRAFSISNDIFIGKNYLGNWTNFTPLIGDLLSSDTSRLEQHKENIPDFLWEYVQNLGDAYLRNFSHLIRNGFWFIKKKI